MNLRTRLLLLGCCFLVFQLAFLYVIFNVDVHPKVDHLEQGLVEKNLTRTMEIVQRELLHLEHTGQSFSSIPLIKRIAMDLPLSEERKQKLLQRMAQQELNLLYVLDINNKVLWEKIIDLNTLEPYPSATFLPTLWKGKPGFLKASSPQKLQTGIYNSFLGPMLMVSAPILSNAPKKPIIGTLIIGKLITPDVIQLIRSLSFTDMRIWPLEGASLSKKHKDILDELSQTESNFLVEKTQSSFQGYIALPDLNNQANLLISVSQSRDFSHTIEVGYMQLGAILVVLQLCFMGIISWLVHRQFATPCRELIHELSTYTHQPIDFTSHEWRDLTQLVHSLTQFMTQYQEVLSQQNTLAYRQGVFFARQEVFHDLQEALEPLTTGIEWIERKLITLPIDDLEWIIAEKKVDYNDTLSPEALIQRLEQINEKLSQYQKETRLRTHELHRRILRNAALLRSHSLRLNTISKHSSKSRS